MRVFLVLSSIFLVINAASDQDLWIEFKNKHGKTYKSLRQEKFRFNIFQEKLREIELHNAKYEKGEVSYFLGVNQFSDMTSEEFASILNQNIDRKPIIPLEEDMDSSAVVPDSINWLERNAVLPVKDQGNCSSCWAFAITGSIESQNIITNNKSISLSEQQLVDCSGRSGNNGCNGGYIDSTYDDILKYGITSESAYPYKGVDGKCEEAQSVVEIIGYAYVGGSEDMLKTAVGTVGPVAAAVRANLWSSYAGGIFDNPLCTGNLLNHVVLVVGYESENGEDYWLIKNSWGLSWGEKGYMRLARNMSSLCGISKEFAYPIM